ncbi:hypothetical protein [Gottschalkia purinilytica]|uniref:hypothetical protein n=1 Tax=Gottschalkia purinilytica TaxID=1503 RepID=UPI0012FF0411|nr:hypothetical protein [Gottschalkia purinilytica]
MKKAYKREHSESINEVIGNKRIVLRIDCKGDYTKSYYFLGFSSLVSGYLFQK